MLEYFAKRKPIENVKSCDDLLRTACVMFVLVYLSSGYRKNNNNRTHVEFILKLDAAWLKPVRCDWTRPNDVHEMSTNCNPIEAKTFEKYAMVAKINHIRSYRGKLRIVLVFAFQWKFLWILFEIQSEILKFQKKSISITVFLWVKRIHQMLAYK